MKEANELLKVMKCFIENRDYVSTENIDEEKLYGLAKKHKVSNFLYHWAKTNAQSELIKQNIQKDYQEQIFRDTNENVELEKIINAFEEAGIETLLIKGAIMKEVYPQSYMRQMCDMDMLVREEDLKKASKIMKDLGYEQFYDYEKHLVFSKKPFILVEIHRRLVKKRDLGSEYLNQDVWDLTMPYQDYQHIKQLTRNNAYFFCMVHLIIHFKATGISIRDILDVYLYNEKYKDELDRAKLNEIFLSYSMVEFEKNMTKIAYRWFRDEEHQDFDDVEKFILQGQSIHVPLNYGIAKENSKFKYLLRLFFPEFNVMQEKYPILTKMPVLLPATWIARFFKDIFSEISTVQERVNMIKLIKKTNIEDVKYMQEIYEKLGIKGEEK